jgi:hypothetical protein
MLNGNKHFWCEITHDKEKQNGMLKIFEEQVQKNSRNKEFQFWRHSNHPEELYSPKFVLKNKTISIKKLDSLANNGFRRYTFTKFLNCKINKTYADVLLTKLGKPNEIRRTNKGTEYLYYYFEIRAMPKNYNVPMAYWYINFKFENDKNYLASIEEGDIDR